MSTKQLRLSDSTQIRRSIVNFVGKKINIVLSDNTVVFGLLTEVNDTEIVLSNMRLKQSRYLFSRIAEVYLDTIS